MKILAAILIVGSFGCFAASLYLDLGAGMTLIGALAGVCALIALQADKKGRPKD
ncbi:MAG TPA: hypothetical protein VG055_04370 [Planctomycetaceae bacterium]|jgi:hypothetical protein|nr:hypothetical protein [Planctomycetaceae bacterium]